jgi:regulatory protein
MEIKNEKILNRMAAMCSRREYCEYDIREKLKKSQLDDTDITTVIKELKERNFINDERFATAYAKDKFQFNGWGKRKIAMMLSFKNIDDDTISNAINNIEQDPYKEKCLALLKSKAKSIKAENLSELKNKLLRFSIGRGFDYETSLQCISEITLQANP